MPVQLPSVDESVAPTVGVPEIVGGAVVFGAVGGDDEGGADELFATFTVTDAEVELKFRGLVSGALGAKGCDRVLAEVWNLDKATTLDGLFESLQRAPTA